MNIVDSIHFDINQIIGRKTKLFRDIAKKYKKEIAAAEDKVAKTQEKIDEYEKAFNVPYLAAERGYIDEVILPSETRERLIMALEALSSKVELVPAKKHGNIPQ